MKAYTMEELELMVKNANCREDLREVSRHVFTNKDLYPEAFCSAIQLKCIERLKLTN